MVCVCVGGYVYLDGWPQPPQSTDSKFPSSNWTRIPSCASEPTWAPSNINCRLSWYKVSFADFPCPATPEKMPLSRYFLFVLRFWFSCCFPAHMIWVAWFDPSKLCFGGWLDIAFFVVCSCQGFLLFFVFISFCKISSTFGPHVGGGVYVSMFLPLFLYPRGRCILFFGPKSHTPTGGILFGGCSFWAGAFLCFFCGSYCFFIPRNLC